MSDYSRGEGGLHDKVTYLSDAETAEILEAGADYIDEVGWIRGRGGNDQEGVCYMGSIYAIGERFLPQLKPITALEIIAGSRFPESFLFSHRAEAWLIARLGGLSVQQWNDVPGRTKEQVTSFMRELAAYLTEQPDPVPDPEKEEPEEDTEQVEPEYQYLT